MALLKLTEDFIRENPNIFYVMECYFRKWKEVYQENGVITYRVSGKDIPKGNTLIEIEIDNTDNFLQIISVK